jgi:2-methylaconitate cis-trans-isomerase PrpF
MGTLHRSFAVSGAISTVGAARIPGTVVCAIMNKKGQRKEMIKIDHPGGIIEVGAIIEEKDGNFHYEEAVLGRTTHRLMEGYVLVPEKYF